MRRRYVAAAGVLALLLAVTTVWAVGGGMGMGPGPGGMRGHHGFFGYLAKSLNLSPAQVTQIQSIIKTQMTTVQPSVQALRQARQDMLTATQGGNFDPNQVRAIANRESQAIVDLIVARQQTMSQIYQQVLTPDQRVKADALRQKLEARITQHMNDMSGAMGGPGGSK